MDRSPPVSSVRGILRTWGCTKYFSWTITAKLHKNIWGWILQMRTLRLREVRAKVTPIVGVEGLSWGQPDPQTCCPRKVPAAQRGVPSPRMIKQQLASWLLSLGIQGGARTVQLGCGDTPRPLCLPQDVQEWGVPPDLLGMGSWSQILRWLQDKRTWKSRDGDGDSGETLRWAVGAGAHVTTGMLLPTQKHLHLRQCVLMLCRARPGYLGGL